MNDALLPLAIILLTAELGALVADRLRLTRVTGQIVAGIIVGPSLLRLVSDDSIISALASVGALSILAIAGLETDIALMRKVGRAALLAASGGVALPMAGGTLVILALGYDVRAALFCGAVLTATSVGITAAALRELGLLSSPAGTTILGAAVIDDVLGLVVLGLVVADTGGASPIATIVPMGLVLGGAVGGLYFLRDRVIGILEHLHSRGGGLAAVVGLVLVLAWVFQSLGGLAGITGAYLAGLALAGSPVGDRTRERLIHAGEALCVPIFFVAVGLSANLGTMTGTAPAAAALLLVAVVGKLIGSAVGARLGGSSGEDSVVVGIGMIARGEVALIAASLGRQVGAIDAGLYAGLVVVALATTVITPVALTLWANRPVRPVPATEIPIALGPGLSLAGRQRVPIGAEHRDRVAAGGATWLELR